MRTRVKFCGLKRPEDIDIANRLRPDYAGFVFWEKSRRSVTEDLAKDLKGRLDPAIKSVGVFVDPDPEYAAHLAYSGIIDIIQLHGSEDDAYIERLRSLTDAPVIKAFEIKSAKDLERVDTCPSDYVLLDAGKGEGITFNWDMIASVKRPYFLAGGLSPDNAGDAIARLHPFALDVSSGIEKDGVKDEGRMRAFMEAVNGKDILI